MYNAISHLLDYGIIFIDKTKLKKNLCDLLYFDAQFIVVVWNQIHNISELHLYVYIYKGKPSDMSPFISPTNMG